ncbi:MAG: hypothetical protein Fur0022_41150 [Anaerolineales bacterium]
MRRELKYPQSNLDVPLELSNSSGKFWDVLRDDYQLSRETYKQHPEKVAQAIFTIVNGWHDNAQPKWA